MTQWNFTLVGSMAWKFNSGDLIALLCVCRSIKSIWLKNGNGAFLLFEKNNYTLQYSILTITIHSYGMNPWGHTFLITILSSLFCLARDAKILDLKAGINVKNCKKKKKSTVYCWFQDTTVHLLSQSKKKALFILLKAKPFGICCSY